jgi:hypothetical protein
MERSVKARSLFDYLALHRQRPQPRERLTPHLIHGRLVDGEEEMAFHLDR